MIIHWREYPNDERTACGQLINDRFRYKSMNVTNDAERATCSRCELSVQRAKRQANGSY